MSEGSKTAAPKGYFNLSIAILLVCGMYPISSGRSSTLRFLYSAYFWCFYIFLVVLNPVSKAIALFHQTKLDDLTGNFSYLSNHTMAVFKIAIFMRKRRDLVRLVRTIEGEEFRHEDCSHGFSPNLLIRKAIRNSQIMYCTLFTLIVGLACNSILSVTMKLSKEFPQDLTNATESADTHAHRHRALPFHSWYPFPTDKSPIYEIVFVYQIAALFAITWPVLALDTMIFAFMMHVESLVVPAVDSSSQEIFCQSTDHLTKIIEQDLERNIAHHQAIVRLSKDLESIFTNQLLLQTICSLLAICTLLWQVSSTPVMSTRFASMLFYLGGTAYQLFLYCWVGNEMMVESLSVANAAWDSGWYDRLSSRWYCHGIAMIIHRSQQEVTITAGGFVGLTLNTFLTILRAAYSCFAVLKKVDN